MVYLDALALFRRHVGRRAYADARSRKLLRGFHHPRQTKIGEIGVALVVNQDIARLDIAVNDPLPVGIIQRAPNLADDAADFS